jgi:tRNA(Ile)-lysidine synthase
MLRAGDRVGVAVSGGADSVALLLLLLELREKLGIVLSVVHFNHQLRGRASDADEKFVAKLAVKHGLDFYVAQEHVAAQAKREKANLEDTARRARYAFFTRLVTEEKITRVAVAHTADDQAETVLGHILRGTGLAGLGGIHPVAGPVLRPLLDVRRKELRAYLRARKQTWREDVSNLDTTRMRARIRKKLLPLLEKQFHPGVVAHLATLAELAREDEAFLEALARTAAETLVQRHDDVARIAVSNLLQPMKEEKETTRSLSKRLVRRMVKESKPRAGQLGAKHVDAILELAMHGENGKSVSLPGGIAVRREHNALLFYATGQECSRSEANAGKRAYEYNIHLASGHAGVRVPEVQCAFRLRVIDWPPKRGETSVTGAVLDRDRLRTPLVLRNWRPGDALRPVGHRNPHKLKRLLNEKRVSRWEKEGWPVLTSGGVLVWARGFPVAAEFAADERTRAGIVIAEEAF